MCIIIIRARDNIIVTEKLITIHRKGVIEMKSLSKKIVVISFVSALLMSTMTGCGDASSSDSSSKEANSKQSQSEVEKNPVQQLK